MSLVVGTINNDDVLISMDMYDGRGMNKYFATEISGCKLIIAGVVIDIIATTFPIFVNCFKNYLDDKRISFNGDKSPSISSLTPLDIMDVTNKFLREIAAEEYVSASLIAESNPKFMIAFESETGNKQLFMYEKGCAIEVENNGYGSIGKGSKAACILLSTFDDLRYYDDCAHHYVIMKCSEFTDDIGTDVANISLKDMKVHIKAINDVPIPKIQCN